MSVRGLILDVPHSIRSIYQLPEAFCFRTVPAAFSSAGPCPPPGVRREAGPSGGGPTLATESGTRGGAGWTHTRKKEINVFSSGRFAAESSGSPVRRVRACLPPASEEPSYYPEIVARAFGYPGNSCSPFLWLTERTMWSHDGALAMFWFIKLNKLKG